MGNDLIQLLTADRTLSVLRAIMLLTVGWTLAWLISRVVRRAAAKRFSVHDLQLAHRLAFYTVFALFVASALRELGFSLTVLMGAAGVLTVAIGFASQTSASNLISGLFLLGERPFAVGDVITVGGTTGEVLSIDALSVKLRTFDNLFVRIPNETLIKSEVTTLTRFPIRRLDLKLGVAYKEDIETVRDVLSSVADKNLLCLDNPEPLFIFLGFGDSALEIQFSVWARREKFLDLRNTIHAQIKAAFDEADIEIPFPHRALYTGNAMKPFPIRVVSNEGTAEGEP
jgi:small-conductance mechanosensitive channel